MADSIVKQATGLNQLASQINVEHVACERALKDGLRHAVQAGKLLIEAKKQCEHGKWLPWIKDKCEFSPRTAQGYMRVANKLLEEGNAQRVAHLSYRQVMVELGDSAASNDFEADLEVLKSICAAARLAFETDNLPVLISLCEYFEDACKNWKAYFEEAIEEIEQCDDVRVCLQHADQSRRALDVFMDDSVRSQRLMGQKLIELEARLGCKLPVDRSGNIDFDSISLACNDRLAELEAVGIPAGCEV